MVDCNMRLERHHDRDMIIYTYFHFMRAKITDPFQNIIHILISDLKVWSSIK